MVGGCFSPLDDHYKMKGRETGTGTGTGNGRGGWTRLLARRVVTVVVVVVVVVAIMEPSVEKAVFVEERTGQAGIYISLNLSLLSFFFLQIQTSGPVDVFGRLIFFQH